MAVVQYEVMGAFEKMFTLLVMFVIFAAGIFVTSVGGAVGILFLVVALLNAAYIMYAVPVKLVLTIEGSTLRLDTFYFIRQTTQSHALASVQGFTYYIGWRKNKPVCLYLVVDGRMYNTSARADRCFMSDMENFIQQAHAAMADAGHPHTTEICSSSSYTPSLRAPPPRPPPTYPKQTRACPHCGKTIGVPEGADAYRCPLCEQVIMADKPPAVAMAIVVQPDEPPAPPPPSAPPAYEDDNQKDAAGPRAPTVPYGGL